MVDNFPLIHSLSTIGIKQHYNCDYLFHPYRTDFSGESGSGKSMVADMIQLILVGSGVYKSSTDSNKSREPKGMVLEPKGRQHGIGYIFLNVKVNHDKYLVMGSYIESSHNKVQAFIIQSGFGWDDKLIPLSHPVSYRDLLIDDKILPIEILEDKLTDIRLKQLSWKRYHQLLYDNELLSLDLNKDKTLESYASILRSFSRGKGFKTDSASLKRFLFGDDDQNKLMQKYQEEVSAINNDYQDHQRYMAEIELINKKQSGIDEILKLNSLYRTLEGKYFTQKIWYWKNQFDNLEKELNDAITQYKISKCKNLLISQKEASLKIEALRKIKDLNNQLQYIKKEDAEHKDNDEALEQKFEKVKEEKLIVDEVEKWLIINDNDSRKIISWYKSEREKLSQKEILTQFIEYLEQQGQVDAFEASEWYSDFENQQIRFIEEMRELEEKIYSLKSLSVFSDLRDENSLALWAKDNLIFPLSHEIVSVLVHFQQFPREEPDANQQGRFLPFPKELFDNLDIKHQTKNGFWIDLDGVYEYIEYTLKRLLGTLNNDELFAQLTSINSGIKEHLDLLIEQKESSRQLKEVLYSYGGLKQAVNLYKKRDKVLAYTSSRAAVLLQEEFDRHIMLFNAKEKIYETYEDIKQEYTDYLSEQKLKNIKIDSIEKEMDLLLSQLKINKLNGLDIEEEIVNKEKYIRDTRLKLDGISLKEINVKLIGNELFSENVDFIEIYNLKVDRTNEHVKKENLKNDLTGKLAHAKNMINDIEQEYLKVFRKDFNFSGSQFVNQDPDIGYDSLKSKYQRAELAFQTSYDQIKKSTEEPDQLCDYSVGMLAHKLLPTVFESPKIDSSLIQERIAERLTKLTRDIQEIGSRKVEILKRVFSEVYKTYNQYLAKINGIDIYLRNKNHAITGGNKASIKHRKSADYPDKWMSPFRKQLDEAVINVGLFEGLKQEVDISKMMIKAFQAAGGSSNVTPEDLLNPKSYFDLDFDLKLDSGESNAGSNGQTYTANALLGLARLSLIETEERKGLRIMPIDEAEGLGGNYAMLHKLARKEKYQIVSMSIETAGDILEGEQYIYIMNENNLADESSYVPPLGIFSDGVLVEDIESFINHNVAEK